MSSKLSRFTLAAALALGVTGVSPALKAQDANRDIVVAATDMRDIVERLEKRTDSFKESFDKAVEHSSLEDTKREDRAEDRANDLHSAAKSLKDEFEDKKDKNHPDVRKKADRTLAAASDLNKVMRSHRFTDELQREWSLIRTDLNAIAAVYQLSPLQ
jgi:hypothetical protein